MNRRDCQIYPNRALEGEVVKSRKRVNMTRNRTEQGTDDSQIEEIQMPKGGVWIHLNYRVMTKMTANEK